MELFKTLATLLACSTTMTIVVRQNKDGKMTVCTNFTDTNGATDTLQPFMLKGSPEELDNGFIQAITEPAQAVNTLVSNIDAFKKSAAEAEKKAKESKPKTAPAAPTGTTNYEAERKRREAEAKAKKENLTATMKELAKCILNGKFNMARELAEYARTLSPDKKEKAELDSKDKIIKANIDTFVCADSAEEGRKAAQEFIATLQKPAAEKEDEKPAGKAEAVTEAENECDGSNEPEENDETEENGDENNEE